jgi:hypothetical protein
VSPLNRQGSWRITSDSELSQLPHLDAKDAFVANAKALYFGVYLLTRVSVSMIYYLCFSTLTIQECFLGFKVNRSLE